MSRYLPKKPKFPAVLSGKSGTRKNWPAYRADNDRYLCTVRARVHDPEESIETARHLDVTHQPSGLRVAFDLPFELAILVSDALFALLGDEEDVEFIKENYAGLPDSVKKWLRDPGTDVPKALKDAAKQTQSRTYRRAKRAARLPAPSKLGAGTTHQSRMPTSARSAPGPLALTSKQFGEAVKELERNLEFIVAKWATLRRISEAQKPD